MKPKLGYLPTDSVFPFQGLDYRTPSTMLDPHFSPSSLNVVVTDSVVQKRGGLAQLGATLIDGNSVMSLADFQTVAGVHFLIAITTRKQYYFEESSASWINITKQASGSDVDLTGDQTDFISYVAVTGLDSGKLFIFTNGVDIPRYWDGNTSSKFLDVAFNYPNLTTCKVLATVNNRVIMGAITDTVYTPQNVAWSDAGKVNEWLAGTAGVQSLFDTDGEIQALVQLADALVVYAENSIHIMTYTGGDAIFVFDKFLTNTRLISPLGIVNLGPYHLFMGQDNIQYFDGSRTSLTVADPIHTVYRDTLSTSYRYKAFAFLDEARKKAYFGFPDTSNNTNLFILDYSVNNLGAWRWSYENLDSPTIMGFYVQNNQLAWNSASISTTSWEAYAGRWSSSTSAKGFPAKVVGYVDGSVYLLSDTSFNDGTSAVSSYWDSMDFCIPQEYQSELMRVTQIEVELQGISVDVLYSTDQGQTFKAIATGLSLTPGWQVYRLYFDVVTRYIRIELANAYLNSTFSFRWLRLWFTPVGPY